MVTPIQAAVLISQRKRRARHALNKGVGAPFVTFRNALVANGYLSRFDRLFIAQATEAASLIDVVSQSSLFTLNSTPTFTPNRGFKGNAVDQSVSSGVNPNSGGIKFTQNSAFSFVWRNVLSANTGTDCGNANNRIGQSASTSNPMFTRSNDGTTNVSSAFFVRFEPFLATLRKASGSYTRIAGSQSETVSVASTGVSSTTLDFLKGNTSYSDKGVAAYGFGSGADWTVEEAEIFRQLLADYLLAIGGFSAPVSIIADDRIITANTADTTPFLNVWKAQNASEAWSLVMPYGVKGGIYEFEKRAGDQWAPDATGDKERNELSSQWVSDIGGTIWWAFHMRKVSASAPHDTFVWLQWHGDDALDRNPIIAGVLQDGELVIISRYWDGAQVVSTEQYRDAAFASDADNYFVMKHVQGASGSLEVWRNGTKIIDFSGGLGYSDALSAGYGKFGIYDQGGATETAKMRFSNFRLGTTDLTALITAPEALLDA
jgi:hypothetical protein